MKNAVRNSDQKGFSRGRGEFANDVRVGEFLAPRIPNSGTAERSRMIGMLSGAPATGAGGAIMMGADPVAAAGFATAGYALPPLVQALMNSGGGRAFLSNQLLAQKGPTKELAAMLMAGRGKDALLNPN
jgi:hypothetical protein